MDTRLQIRLSRVARRIRSMRTGWCLALTWALSALVGLILIAAKTAGTPGLAQAHWWWLLGTLLAGCIVWLLVRRRNDSLQIVAGRVEERFPTLNQSLITAAGIPVGDSSLGFLQRSVISQAIRHDVAYHWRSIVPGPKIVLSWLANVPALICMGLVGVNLWQAPYQPNAPSVTSRGPNTLTPPLVTPGNTEVERGTSLIVTARFDGQLPNEVHLLQTPLADTPTSDANQRFVMRQSLNDPIFAAYLYDVQQPIEYVVEYDGVPTEAYRVDVFELPALVRADAELRYPSYTGMETKSVVDTRRVTAAIGTQLTWQLHLNKPVAAAELVPVIQDSLQETESIALLPSDDLPTMVEGSIRLEKSVTWQLRLMDHEGRQNSVQVSLRAKVLANRETRIELTQGGDTQVSPLEEFDIAAKIKDDFAVKAAGIGYQFAGGELMEIQSPVSSLGREVRLSEMIDFEALGAEPAQLLSYYVWAEDEDEAGQSRRTVSDMFFAEVRPFEEIFREGEQQASGQQQQQQGQPQGNQQTEELLELQKNVVVGTWNTLRKTRREELADDLTEDINVLIESQQQAIKLLADKAEEANIEGADQIIASVQQNMTAAVESLTAAIENKSKQDLQSSLGKEQAAYQGLLKLQSREFEIARSQRSSSSQSSSQRARNRQQQIDQLRLQNDENRYENERLAQEQQNQEQSELRQALSRLRELAARQEDLNEQVRELEAALQAAETEKEREDLQRQLERLREQQQQMLQDTDELQQRMESSQNESLQQAQEQLEQARENLQQSNEALRQGNTSQALASGTRAEQDLKDLQEEVRQQAANQFAETMQQMKSKASELEQQQEQIIQEMLAAPEESQAGLRSDQKQTDVGERVEQQRQELEGLLEQMQETVTASEDAEPLLAQKLYDSYRRTQQQRTEQRLEMTEQLLERNLTQQALETAGEVQQDLGALREDIDQAAEAVLGSEVDSLRLALNQLERLNEQLDSEISEATGRPRPNQQPSESNAPPGDEAVNENRTNGQADGESSSEAAQSTEAQPRTPGDAQSEQPQEQQSENQVGGSGSPNAQQQQQQQQQQSSSQQSNPSQQSSQSQSRGGGGSQSVSESRPGQSGSREPQVGSQSGLRQGSSQAAQDGAGDPFGLGLTGGGNPRPLTGDEFRDWSDRLRDVEELVTDPELRWQATQIRQAARDIRIEVRKHAADPKWAEVEDLVAKPLRDLRRKVSDELIRRVAEKTEIVPIDRDPVPSEFDRSVREYYENLGAGR